MLYKKLYLYLISFIAGMFTHSYLLSFLLPLLLNIVFLECSFIFLSYIFLAGYFWYKFLIPAAIVFASATGTIEYITNQHVYLSDVTSTTRSIPSQLKLKYKELDSSKIGDKIKFNCFYYPSKTGKLNKIYQTEPNKPNFLQRYRVKIRDFCNYSKFSAFLKSIIIGDRSGFSIDEVNNLKQSGFWHLIAISGLHMNIIVLSIFNTLKKIFSLSFNLNYKINSRLLAAFISIIIGILYVQISLLSIPAIRALIMTGSFMIFGGMIDTKKLLLLIAFGMIILNPYLVFDMSFQLSFLCTWILVSYRSIILLNFSILPIIQQFNLVCILTNFIVLPLFSMSLVIVIFAICFNSIFILRIVDFICILIFKVINLPTILMKFKFNQAISILFLVLFNITILNNSRAPLLIGVGIIWLISMCL